MAFSTSSSTRIPGAGQFLSFLCWTGIRQIFHELNLTPLSCSLLTIFPFWFPLPNTFHQVSDQNMVLPLCFFSSIWFCFSLPAVLREPECWGYFDELPGLSGLGASRWSRFLFPLLQFTNRDISCARAPWVPPAQPELCSYMTAGRCKVHQTRHFALEGGYLSTRVAATSPGAQRGTLRQQPVDEHLQTEPPQCAHPAAVEMMVLLYPAISSIPRSGYLPAPAFLFWAVYRQPSAPPLIVQ